MLQADSDTLSLPELSGRKTYEVDGTLGFSADDFAGFFRGNPSLHTELPNRQVGMSVVSLPYMLRNDDWMTGALFVCLVLLVYAYNKMRHRLRQMTREFFLSSHQHTGSFTVETSAEKSARRYMSFQLCMLGGVMIFGYSQNEFDYHLGQLSPHLLLITYVVGFFLCVLSKRLLMRLVNWVFFPKTQQKAWNDINYYIITVESIVYFPLALVYVYFQIPYEAALALFFFILLILKILLAFKTYHIFFTKSYGLFHLFVYLCALEIMPLLVIWKTLVMLTESWIVKY